MLEDRSVTIFCGNENAKCVGCLEASSGRFLSDLNPNNLTRQADVELFDDARLDFLVFDEAHTFGGAGGAETACLIRHLRAYCGKSEALEHLPYHDFFQLS